MTAARFPHRLLVIAPAAKCAALNAWVAANIDAGGGDYFTPSLSVTDTAPATYAWVSFAADDDDGKAILAKLCQLAVVTPPTLAQWTGWDQSAKISWLKGVQSAIYSSYGVFVTLSANDGDWGDPTAILNTLGLKQVAS